MTVTANPMPLEPTAADIQAALADPFDPIELKMFPRVVTQDKARALGVAYIDARLVMDRLDAVLGIGGWQDEYRDGPDGTVTCRLSCWIDGRWVTREDAGNPSEQPDKGDQRKAAISDALKRAAVKFGVGRYLYRIPGQWLNYDAQKRQITGRPSLPAFALPAVMRPALPGVTLRALPAPTEPDPAELCDERTAKEIDRLIREQTRSKRWVAVLSHFNVKTPSEWTEPADPADATSVCEWLSATDALQILTALRGYAKPANGANRK